MPITLYIYDIGHGSGARDGQFIKHLPLTRLLKIITVFGHCSGVTSIQYLAVYYCTVAFQYSTSFIPTLEATFFRLLNLQYASTVLQGIL